MFHQSFYTLKSEFKQEEKKTIIKKKHGKIIIIFFVVGKNLEGSVRLSKFLKFNIGILIILH